MERMLRIIAHVRGIEEQEILRRILDRGLWEMYNIVRGGTKLPARSALAMLSAEAYEALLKSIHAPRKPRRIKAPIGARKAEAALHVG